MVLGSLVSELRVGRSHLSRGSELALDGPKRQRVRSERGILITKVRAGQEVGSSAEGKVYKVDLETLSEKVRGPSRLAIWLGRLDLAGVEIAMDEDDGEGLDYLWRGEALDVHLAGYAGSCREVLAPLPVYVDVESSAHTHGLRSNRLPRQRVGDDDGLVSDGLWAENGYVLALSGTARGGHDRVWAAEAISREILFWVFGEEYILHGP